MVPNSYCGRDRIKAWMVYFIRHSWCFVFEIYLLQYNTTWTFQKIGLFVIRLITSRQLTLPRPQYEIAIWQHLFGTTEIYVIKLILLINHKQFSINLLFVHTKKYGVTTFVNTVMNEANIFWAQHEVNMPAGVAKGKSAWLSYNPIYQTEFESEEGAIFARHNTNKLTFKSISLHLRVIQQ